MFGRPIPRPATPEIVGRILFGLMLIGLGAALLGARLGWLNANRVLSLAWPLTLILPGVLLLTKRRYPQNLVGGALVLAGLCAFAGELRWIHVNPWVASGPILIVLVGGSVMWKALRAPRA